MIVKAAVKVLNLHTNEEMTIPCHRHCDAFYILHLFNMKQSVDYKQVEQGFLDEHGNFYDRIAAKKHAQEFNQLKENTRCAELFSEDLW
jgi:hypothetical protein